MKLSQTSGLIKVKIVATIEARMGSSRLPNKVLMDIGGMKSLECQIKRLKRSKLIDTIVIATTDKSSDDLLVAFADDMDVACFRGSEQDILARILGAAKSQDASLQVQITGDCPLIDPEIVDQVIQCYLDNSKDFDFVSNEIERSYPIGLDCRVFPTTVLEEVDRDCKDPIHRIHGSTYIYMGPGKNKYKSKNFFAPNELNHPLWRWTLDTPEDLEFFKSVLNHFKEEIINLTSIELKNWLVKNPDIVEVNSKVRQKTIEEG